MRCFRRGAAGVDAVFVEAAAGDGPLFVAAIVTDRGAAAAAADEDEDVDDAGRISSSSSFDEEDDVLDDVLSSSSRSTISSVFELMEDEKLHGQAAVHCNEATSWQVKKKLNTEKNTETPRVSAYVP